MKKFRVLLVDDDREHILDVAIDECKDLLDVELIAANSFEEGLSFVKSQFFHAALVDLRLSKSDDNNFDGQRLLAKIAKLRPTCERILITTHVNQNAEDVVSMVHPLHPDVHGIINKYTGVDSVRAFILARSQAWGANSIEVIGASKVVQLLGHRMRHHHGAISSITEAEIEYLVARLFGQGRGEIGWAEEFGRANQERVSKVELDIPDQGYSASLVVKARSISSKGAPGIWCIVKLSLRDYAYKERDGYERFVRFRLNGKHRVELLGFELGDRLGALCYNFAAGGPDEVTSAGRLLKSGHGERFERAFKQLFNPNAKTWYAHNGEEQRLVDFFHNVFGWTRQKTHKRLLRCLVDLGPIAAQLETVEELTLENNIRVANPESAVVKKEFNVRKPTVIVHGDMHCENVLVDTDGAPRLIDFYSVRFGPRGLDFAAVEESIRRVVDKEDQREINFERTILLEDSLWKSVWGDNQTAPFMPAEDELWMRAARTIACCLRENFPDLEEKEYAATCLFWCLRMLMIQQFEERSENRICIWACYLAGRL